MKRNSNQIIISTAVFFVFLLFLPSQNAFGAAEGELAAAGYHYVKEGKPDPFKPFIEIRVEKKETKAEEKAKKIERARTLPPLERFGVEEFKLVGIIWNEKSKVAVVEDSKGKHHSLSEGSHIGLNSGKVEKILPDQIVVVEKIKDAFDNVRPERATIKLMREEDEGEL